MSELRWVKGELTGSCVGKATKKRGGSGLARWYELSLVDAVISHWTPVAGPPAEHSRPPPFRQPKLRDAKLISTQPGARDEALSLTNLSVWNWSVRDQREAGGESRCTLVGTVYAEVVSGTRRHAPTDEEERLGPWGIVTLLLAAIVGFWLWRSCGPATCGVWASTILGSWWAHRARNKRRTPPTTRSAVLQGLLAGLLILGMTGLMLGLIVLTRAPVCGDAESIAVLLSLAGVIATTLLSVRWPLPWVWMIWSVVVLMWCGRGQTDCARLWLDRARTAVNAVLPLPLVQSQGDGFESGSSGASSGAAGGDVSAESAGATRARRDGRVGSPGGARSAGGEGSGSGFGSGAGSGNAAASGGADSSGKAAPAAPRPGFGSGANFGRSAGEGDASGADAEKRIASGTTAQQEADSRANAEGGSASGANAERGETWGGDAQRGAASGATAHQASASGGNGEPKLAPGVAPEQPGPLRGAARGRQDLDDESLEARGEARMSLSDALSDAQPFFDGSTRVTMPGDLLFAFDEDELTPRAEPILRQLADLLRRQPSQRVVLEGHADSIGSDDYNVDLSDRRARAVRHWLIQQAHINPQRLDTIGYGSARPLVSRSKAPSEQQPNRRVEVRVLR